MQLNGYIPSIVGKEPTCWVELCREPDKVFLQLAVVAQKRFLISAQKKNPACQSLIWLASFVNGTTPEDSEDHAEHRPSGPQCSPRTEPDKSLV